MSAQLEGWRQIQWDLVDRVFRTGSDRCSGCCFFKTWEERHPYGSTTAAEVFEECRLLEGAHGEPGDCPGYKDLNEELSDGLAAELEIGL